MRRRDLLGGVASLGVLGGAGWILQNGPPSFEAETEPTDDESATDDGPIEVETVDARGSEAGSMTVPDDQATVIMFFANACGTCQVQAGRLADASASLEDDHGSDVRFLSVTYDSREQLPPDDLREWWETHRGDGFVSYDTAELMRRYSAVGYPVTIVVDTDGEERWRETGTTDGSDIAGAVESVIEGDDRLGSETDDEEDGTSNGEDGTNDGEDETDESESEGSEGDGNETDDDAGTENETDD